MKKVIILFFTVGFMACNNDASFKKAEDAQEAAREFIRASLDGNYDKALFYLYKDSANANQMLLDKWKSDYDKLPQEDKVNFKEANIVVMNTEKVNDSTINFTYSNSYKKKNTTIKVIRDRGEWVIDLKDIH